uniref:Transmembrane channel-like protein n=1 Tax=Kryptolebias marmoratus TaxID=37003 RepID=A0A3Q3GR97_KRYMA
NQLIAEQSRTDELADAFDLQEELDNRDRGIQFEMHLVLIPPGRNRGAIISQYYNKTLRLRRRRQSKPQVRDFSRSSRPSIRGYGLQADTTDSEDREDRKQEQLVNNLQKMSVADRERMLREMPLSKPCFMFRVVYLQALKQRLYIRLTFIPSLQLWKVSLKKVSGRFGSGVLSYFLFLRILLFFNIFLFLVMSAFLVVPQALYPPEPPANRSSFSGLELLTGAGYFSDSLMYYGYYHNDTLKMSCKNSTQEECEAKSPSYNMPLAYFFTIGMAFFITCIILVYSMSKSFGQSFKIDKSRSALAIKTFCSWDFRVTKKSSVKLMSENISTQLKVLTNTPLKPLSQKLKRFALQFLSWIVCITVTIGCVVGIYYFSEYRHGQRCSLVGEVSLLDLPVLVSVINLLLSFLFALCLEEYTSPSVRTYVALGRNLVLKVSVLGVLCYHWLGHICWETFVGQELYRFLIVDFIFTLLDTLFGELIWRLLYDKIFKKKRKPEFNIAKNVLDLIYGQSLAWLGVLFTPLLPAVQILKLFLLFYIKMSSVMMNCQAPRKPYRVTQMTTIFITLLCFPSFLGASVCVTYTMWSIKPSESCGPFRGLDTMFQAGKRWMHQMEDQNPKLSLLTKAHLYLVENPFFLFVGAGIFLIGIYFHSQVIDGQRQIIALLQKHIKNVGHLPVCMHSSLFGLIGAPDVPFILMNLVDLLLFLRRERIKSS